ncbi:MAG: hypothetical protein HYR64_01740 [Fimbriimonas ginsengisoli]|uniref:Uncharacterized protein n=1 Tax=Fimbriimonas ginsengisoli TaxID=1005039 RepID=A0A931LTC7_FIMGI|nr:hypothetical protein [Fimbriimonas ginsengisoli]
MKKAVGERGATAMQRASACYGLIFEGERAGLWVDSMVRQARNTKGLTPAADPIAEALLHVYATTRSKRAFHHLVTLRLDGGPEETLWAVREDMLAAYPGDTANYLRRRYGKLDNPGIYRRIPRGHEFIGSLTWELQGETEACERLKGRVSRSRGAKADRDYIVAVLNRIERLRPG